MNPAQVGTSKQLLEALVSLYLEFSPSVVGRITVAEITKAFTVCSVKKVDVEDITHQVQPISLERLLTPS